jgi:hypothetical protein
MPIDGAYDVLQAIAGQSDARVKPITSRAVLGYVCSCFLADFFNRKVEKSKTEINGKFLTGFCNVEKQTSEEIN